MAQQVIKGEIVSASPLISLAAVPCVLPTFQLVGAGNSPGVSLPLLLPGSHSASAIGVAPHPSRSSKLPHVVMSCAQPLLAVGQAVGTDSAVQGPAGMAAVEEGIGALGTRP